MANEGQLGGFMMRALVISVSIFLASCTAINQETMKKAVLVDPGMTKEQVIALLGSPGDRQFKGTDEAWQYCQTGWGNTDKFTVVWFQRGRVTGVTNYNRSDYVGICENHFKTVNWEDAPDAAIEIRHR